MAILEVTDIHKSFGSEAILKGISFSMEPGESVSIIGSSGSGKTTLLRCMNFLETPDKGTITVKGNVIYDAAAPVLTPAQIRERRKHFGLVFQQFNLFPQYTALENVMLAPKLTFENPDLKKIEADAKELLDKMGLSDRMGNYPHQLSGGQQQRVSIGRALYSHPAILLADEPTGNLDRKTGEEIIALLKESNRTMNQTLILITHDERIAMQADRVISIEDGRIVRNEKVRNVV